MRIISRKTLIEFWKKHPNSEHPLRAWFDEVKKFNWNNHNDVKKHYKSVSIISGKRLIFNIKGNDYRLIVEIEYKLKIVFIVWIGTHKDYDKINVKEIRYD